MFNNVIYIIIALVIFSINYPGKALFGSPIIAIAILFFLWFLFALFCKYQFSKILRLHTSNSHNLIDIDNLGSYYQSLVTRLSILSIAVFAASIYLINLKYWLLKIPGFITFSILPGTAAILIFFTFLVTIWFHGYGVYHIFSNSTITKSVYVTSNIKLNLPVIFPWAILTAFYDATTLFAGPSLKNFFESGVGQFLFLSLFMILLALFLPPLIKYWWGCSSMPQSKKKDSMVRFFRENNFKYRDIVRWPLLGGQMVTAGVMGLLPNLRYILVTDPLLNILSEDEINAVMAHEMGHVKYMHVFFYMLFLLGYIGISIGIFDFFIYAMATQPWLIGLLNSHHGIHKSLFYFLLSIPIILSVIVYFRYIMGFFMRNFERQADLYSAKIMGRAEPIIMSLEKIASVSGQSRFQPSWHHFSIAERVDFLWRFLQDRQLLKHHSRQIALFLSLFFGVVIFLVYSINFGPLKKDVEQIFIENALTQQISESPDNIEIYRALAYIYNRKGDMVKAKWAYENILRLHPNNGQALNNLAWILATAKDNKLIDYARSLILAKRAVDVNRSATFLDTLAEAYYVNDLYDQALQAIKEALDIATGNREYLVRQMNKFKKAQATKKHIIP
ncbi:MAG: M48 family metalloprotease [Thermodesulfobacteriota bacterium]|nr:M48 family metalloprotease [Thermodesulfobacteriota bacterium]